MTLERGVLIVFAFALVGLGFYLRVYVLPKRETLWSQLTIVGAIILVVGAGGMSLLIATTAP